MNEKRKFRRFSVQLNAFYSYDEGASLQPCTITDISREGTKIELRTSEKINQDALVNLVIQLPGKAESIKCVLLLQWIEKKKTQAAIYFSCGGHFKLITREDKWLLLEYAFDRWKKNESHKRNAAS